MNKVVLNSLIMIGLNKGALKIAVVTGFIFSFLSDWISKTPDVIFGITIFLWVPYVFTIMLDWLSGITASRFEAKAKGENFKFDKDKANSNWYKHALFIIIISSIYNLQKESLRLEMNTVINNSLIGLQLGYFTYNMITEWISIENNRYRVNGKHSRIGNLLQNILNLIDKITLQKIEKLTGADKDK